jgi:hypothetical protein
MDDWVYLAAVMAALPLLDNLLAMFGRIDKWIEGEHQRLRARYPDKKISWHEYMFAKTYCNLTDVSGIQQLIRAAGTGRWTRSKDSYDRVAALLANHAFLSPGQLYFLMEEFSAWCGRKEPSPPFLYGLAQQAWRLGIYDLRLATARMLLVQADQVPEEERIQFVELVKGCHSDDPMLNDQVFHVLKAFGAFAHDFTSEQASAEFNEVIEAPLSQSICERAFTLYYRHQFHPYDRAYRKAFFELTATRRAKLCARAVFAEATESCERSQLAPSGAGSRVPRMV